MAQFRRPKGKVERLRLDQLISDARLQMRADAPDDVAVTDPDHAMGIAKAIKSGKAKGLERVKVRRVTDGKTVKNYVTDGFHTVEGYRLANVKVVPCDVLCGTWNDAFIDSCGANAQHVAKKRTTADREKAVRKLMGHLKKTITRSISLNYSMHKSGDKAFRHRFSVTNLNWFRNAF